jgi:hypothetical protein
MRSPMAPYAAAEKQDFGTSRRQLCGHAISLAERSEGPWWPVIRSALMMSIHHRFVTRGLDPRVHPLRKSA